MFQLGKQKTLAKNRKLNKTEMFKNQPPGLGPPGGPPMPKQKTRQNGFTKKKTPAHPFPPILHHCSQILEILYYLQYFIRLTSIQP